MVLVYILVGLSQIFLMVSFAVSSSSGTPRRAARGLGAASSWVGLGATSSLLFSIGWIIGRREHGAGHRGLYP